MIVGEEFYSSIALYCSTIFFEIDGRFWRCIMMYPSGIFEQVTGSSMSEFQGMMLAENRLEKKRLWGKHAMDCWVSFS